MALKSTIFKAELQISDLRRHYYQTHTLTIARHPSENDERMMTRLLAFALYASEDTAFGGGLSADDEPDLHVKDLTGAIKLWIDVGQPDPKLIRKACNRADQVVVIPFGRSSEVWWRQQQDELARFDNLAVLSIAHASTQAIAAMADRTMRLQCTIEDDQVWFSDARDNVSLNLDWLKTDSRLAS